MGGVPMPAQSPIAERDLIRWKLVADFKERLAKVWNNEPAHSTWADPERKLQVADYLSLFLFGLFNPVARTMRGLSAASRLPRVQEEICTKAVSLGSFSEAQHLLEPSLLEGIFSSLSHEARESGSERRSWLIQDGSLFAALPRMHWALWRRQGKAQSQVRLHLSLDMETGLPARAVITPGKQCERKAWQSQWQRGDAYVGDRYYAENYKLFSQMEQKGVAFVVRLRDEAVIEVKEELTLLPTDRQHQVIRSAWAILGCKTRYQSMRVRVIWVQTDKEVLRLVTNLGVEELAAAEVALLYKQRWQIELFFRWIKCILGCRHWLAESAEGVAIQIYLALIAALLLQLYTGQKPSRRMMELIQFYALGVASIENVEAQLQRDKVRLEAKKKKAQES
jgi:hypothetical protein